MKKIKLKKGLISQKIKNKVNIFDGEESTIYSFNDSATFIFEKIKQGQDKKEITAAMIKKYSISQDTANKDFDEFIQELEAKKIAS